MTLYFSSEGERNVWYNVIQSASNNIDILSNYRLLETIGVGKFATVRKAQLLEDESQYAAVKIISKRSLEAADKINLYNEISIHSTVHHPCIAKIIGIFETPERVFFVMKLMGEGDLFTHISDNKTLDLPEATHIAYKILKALEYFKEFQILHRDLKPENLLIEKENKRVKEVYVIDFGIARYVDTRNR